jgi:two-component system, cell cycle response regulator
MLRILLIDDSWGVRSKIRQVLEQAFEGVVVLEASDGMQGFRMLKEARPDVVLCDLVMPGSDGAKFLALRASRAELRDVPVLMLTAETEVSRKLEVLDRGAADYVTKPFDPRELVARVRVHHRLKVLQDNLRDANLRLEKLSTTDGLTGLYNRRHFDGALIDELKRSLRYKAPFSVVLLDVDHFKRVNDEHGHGMGDAVLVGVSRALRGALRNIDVLARYGGEEFVVLLPQTPLTGAFNVAERLRAVVADVVHTLGRVSLSKTASFGVVSYDGRDVSLGMEELMRRADQALYAAKRTGRNRVVCYSPGCEPAASIPAASAAAVGIN